MTLKTKQKYASSVTGSEKVTRIRIFVCAKFFLFLEVLW